jgi:hypothetical protein
MTSVSYLTNDMSNMQTMMQVNSFMNNPPAFGHLKIHFLLQCQINRWIHKQENITTIVFIKSLVMD